MSSPEEDQPISVVMPVHNAPPYLDDALQRILNKTQSDFKFVIYDDGSTAGSRERLAYWTRRDSGMSGRSLLHSIAGWRGRFHADAPANKPR